MARSPRSAAPAFVVRAALVVDHDPAARAEALAALAVFPDAEVKCAATRAEAEHLIRRRHFDVAVVDLDLPDDGGAAVVRRLASPTPGLSLRPTVCVPSGTHPGSVPGVRGGLRDLLLAAVRGAAEEPAPAPADMNTVPADTSDARPAAEAPGSPLSPREVDVVRLVTDGRTVAAAARELGVSENTVKAHLKRAYAKLDVRTRAAAADAARRLGLLRDDFVEPV